MKITQFGDPVLRQKAKDLSTKDIKSPTTQKLIKEMRELLLARKLGIGLAAPQIGEGLALAVICIRPTPHRPDVEKFDLIIINPKIVKTFGNRKQQWEGCISGGPLNSGLFAKVSRYKKLELKYLNEKGIQKQEVFAGLKAHIIQHEVDHLNGTLFVDKVKDSKSFVTYSEYLKIAKAEKKKK